ncbi:hypothetical protein JI721_12055 [Alicyclobacillus cycloheptanicus]|uniref:Uncharacterized protein n=1 Tax=Alicyclobacillus cycloheptanicus TaxID=1457 RepID=A0ABT9XLT6_9BACL|nr:hypothetical protein [Alicyclobacillus cycloheptanicus]MDQ0191273.1 hypothetical protein [Alicyclobacillus cycloheptanicus]WDM00451.1 hypothetical protein JI721_12055 [Alicyclobacillus cycloheptanicus]
MSGVIVNVPDPYKEIAAGIEFVLFALLFWFLLYVGSRNRALSFDEDALVFPKTRIRADEIKHIYIQERWPNFTVFFKGKYKVPISVAFKKCDMDEILSELRQWTWRNGVETKTDLGWRRKRSNKQN